jgi:60 kDa SS-A/Ro ribonucleoprotein
MVHKGLFAPAGKAPPADSMNAAKGRAYAFSPEHALAQYAATGTFYGTFYANEKEQLDKVLELASKVSPEFVAKTAVFARERGYMKDMPAFLAAVLAARDVRLLATIFPRVIDSGKMLRNFVQIVRSGVVGRKSFGTAPKRLAQGWFKSRSPEAIFRQSLGSDPSMKDVIKMVRPSPKDAKGEVDKVRNALYGYLIGKDVTIDDLPQTVRAFEAFKKGEGPVPDVPFEMLTALELSTEHWNEIAKTMSWTQTRMNLNTLRRHGVLEGAEMVALVAERLRNAGAIRKARAFPYQLLAAYRAAGADMPGAITLGLQEALEISIENVPSVAGKIFLCPDVSGSMQSPVTGRRSSATTAVRCIDVAALVAAAFLRRNTTAEVIPFSDDVVPMPRRLNPLDSVMTNAERLAALPSGGTACSAPLRHLNSRAAKGDLVVYVSDNMSWADFGLVKTGYGTRGTVMAEEWMRFRARSPDAKLVLVDIQPYGTTQVAERSDVLNVGGFSDAVFNIVSFFAKGELGAGHWVGEIERVTL